MIERKNAFTISRHDQEAYINGVTAMIADGTYGRLVAIHANMRHRMHTMRLPGRIGTWRFLPWHRAYLLHMEEELRRKEPTAFIPYWKWVDGGVPAWLAGFKPTVPVAGRSPIVNNRVNLTAPITTSSRITTLKAMTDYFTFSYALERDPHNRGHVVLGVPMQNVPTAPADPIFFMHHGEVDRVWAEWQVLHPGRGPVLTGADAIMDPWSETASGLSSISALDYSYV